MLVRTYNAINLLYCMWCVCVCVCVLLGPPLIETIRLTGKADYLCHIMSLNASSASTVRVPVHPHRYIHLHFHYHPRYTVFNVDSITFHTSQCHHDNMNMLHLFIAYFLIHHSLLARLDFIRLERELHTFKPTLSKPPKYITARYKVKTGKICESL